MRPRRIRAGRSQRDGLGAPGKTPQLHFEVEGEQRRPLKTPHRGTKIIAGGLPEAQGAVTGLSEPREVARRAQEPRERVWSITAR